MSETKQKLSKMGTVWEKKDGSGFFVKLGNEGKNTKYNLSVEVIVKDSEGNVIAKQTDGFLTLKDPRDSQFANKEALDKVPGLRFEILIPNN